MIFGDGAAGLVVAPTPDDAAGDVDVLQTYASGPESQVNSIIWPNVEFGCDITVYGPEVKALVKRYLKQMIGELHTLPHPAGGPGTLVDAIDLIIPHQASPALLVVDGRGRRLRRPEPRRLPRRARRRGAPEGRQVEQREAGPVDSPDPRHSWAASSRAGPQTDSGPAAVVRDCSCGRGGVVKEIRTSATGSS